MARRWQDAEALYRVILKKQPMHPDANHNLGVLAISFNKSEIALPLFKIAVEANPNQGQFWISYVDALIKTNQLDLAKSVLDHGKKLGLVGEIVDALEKQIVKFNVNLITKETETNKLTIANELLEAGKYQEAQDWLNNYLKDQSRDAEAWSLLSQVLISKNNTIEAEKAIATAKSINANVISIYRNETRLLLKKSNPKAALLIAQKVYELSIDEAENWLVLGACLVANQRDSEAILLIERVLIARPNYAEAYANRAIIRLRIKDITGALHDSELAVTLKPHHSQLWGLLGSIRSQGNNLSGAVDALKRAHELDPTNINYLTDLGEFCRQNKKIAEAVIFLKKATTLAPENVNAWTNLGAAFQQDKKIDDAKGAYEKALAINPKSSVIMSNLGAIAKEQGFLDSALRYFEQAISLNLSFAEAYSNLGNTLKELGRLEEAEISHKKAIALKPDDVDALAKLSLTLIFMDKLNEATQVLLKIIAKDPDNYGLKALVNLAVLNFLNGNSSSSRLFIVDSLPILNKKSFSFKNEVAYWKYLSALFDKQQLYLQDGIEHINFEKLYVIGESHSLSSHGLCIEAKGSFHICESLWIVGCKQWHLANLTENQYKYKFQKIIQSIPKKSNILIAIGEIDCRLDDGILKHIKSHPDKNINELIALTISGYLEYISKALTSFTQVTIQGVPCPNINLANANENDVAELISLIREFNFILKKQSNLMGFNFLDVHKLTDRGDGFSNAIWHLDTYHLSPEGMLEAWRRHFSQNSIKRS